LTESAEVEVEIRLDQDSTVSAPADQLRDVFVAAGLSLPEPGAVASDIPLPDQIPSDVKSWLGDSLRAGLSRNLSLRTAKAADGLIGL